MYPAGNLFIPAPHGKLEAIYRPKNTQAERVALVLHPHPLFGGTMHNKVVFRAAKALQESGFETLRFNFRGVGHSTGEHDDGVGETDDAHLALEYLLTDQPQAREVIVAGFSFGSIVGMRLGCADARVDRLIAIGAPARMSNLDFLRDCTKPKIFIHGAEDDIAPLAPLEAFLGELPASSNHRLVRIAGAGHFFDDQAEELMKAVKDFVQQ
ncbi:MAG TPA: alpha/beta fold hydrolase [Blastocatellia bacterium]|nr:alpha/beta fold hydrolase [Blastocatellia bacterium]HMX27145.1 alpha/beta fold hydrolase [Blastocatellia bacterium]HMY74672.1 alpha/beta fold hydrolase [Blastocatellia bacterium]HMZ16629.1 alpha/beta fold hydrolase [Blastocatellia bacterium]HNG32068.1 alpha/beta fold hydrolase [Blastocatellia bacterium]